MTGSALAANADAKLVVVGQGYVGLPIAMRAGTGSTPPTLCPPGGAGPANSCCGPSSGAGRAAPSPTSSRPRGAAPGATGVPGPQRVLRGAIGPRGGRCVGRTGRREHLGAVPAARGRTSRRRPCRPAAGQRPDRSAGRSPGGSAAVLRGRPTTRGASDPAGRLDRPGGARRGHDHPSAPWRHRCDRRSALPAHAPPVRGRGRRGSARGSLDGCLGRGGRLLASGVAAYMRWAVRRADAVLYVTAERLQRRYPSRRGAAEAGMADVVLCADAFVAAPRR